MEPLTAKQTCSFVKLRDPVDADAQVHFAHPPSAEIVRMYGGDATNLPVADPVRSDHWLRWFRDHPFAKMIVCEGKAVGHVRLHNLDKADKRARLAIGLFAEADLGRGIGRKAIALTLDQAFGRLGLHRVDLRVLAFNIRAIRCYEACGFDHEGTEREAVRIGGAWEDEWIMGILAQEHKTAQQ